MISKKKKLYLFDIDGTLFDNNKKEVPRSTILALEELRKNAHVGIATGRSSFMLYSIEEIVHLFDDFVLINGQYIKTKGSVIYKDKIDITLLDQLCEHMELLNLTYGFQGSDHEAVSKLDNRALRSFEKLGLDLTPIDKEFYKNNDVYQAWVFCDHEDVEILQKDNPEFQFIKWLDVGYDILPKAANKGLGVKRLAEYLEIPLEDVVVFGDGDNDYEMIKDAGLGIAMGNATSKAKAVADYITDSVDNDGIYKALKHFGFIK